jgi:hypothetical protein
MASKYGEELFGESFGLICQMVPSGDIIYATQAKKMSIENIQLSS